MIINVFTPTCRKCNYKKWPLFSAIRCTHPKANDDGTERKLTSDEKAESIHTDCAPSWCPYIREVARWEVKGSESRYFSGSSD